MSSAQDPFYIVKEEIQESVSFLCGYLIFVSIFWKKEAFVDPKRNGQINFGNFEDLYTFVMPCCYYF